MRKCPVCEHAERTQIFSMDYQIPEGWTLPSTIDWHSCDKCGMIYGDGDFDQAMLNQYYKERYGYGVYNADNVERLKWDAAAILAMGTDKSVVDFGGAGDDGKSTLVEHLKKHGLNNAYCVGAGNKIPDCDVIYASHVFEHIYDLPQTMKRLTDALAPDGRLIVDVPDATGLLCRWKMPILDFNTKHVNHFTLRNLLDLGNNHGLEAVLVKPYELEYAPCYQVHFKRLDVAKASAKHVNKNDNERILKLLAIEEPFNIWGMSDIVWHTLASVLPAPKVLNYIDNDPAYRGTTYKGKSVLEAPDNDAPIVIMAQGQRGRLIENIRAAGIKNRIIEI